MKFEINIAKKHLYYVLGFVVFVFIVGIAIAQTVNNPGHPAEQIDEGTIAGTLTVSNNNVGIGTTSPATPLHIDAGAETEALRLEGDASTFMSFYEGANRRGFVQYDTALNEITVAAEEAGSTLALRTANTVRMKIDSTGNVGIGTTSPQFRLDVKGSGGINIDDGDNYGRLFSDTSGGLVFLAKQPSSGMIFYTGGNGGANERMRILANGNVGIGITSPGEKLEVSGNIKSTNLASTTITGSRCVYVDSGGVLRAKTQDCGTATGGDDLGSHIATQSIYMNNNNVDGINQLIFTSPTANEWRLATYNDDKLYIVREASKFVTVDNAGNVGIGTTAPSDTLHVQGTAKISNSASDAKLLWYPNTGGTPNNWVTGVDYSDSYKFKISGGTTGTPDLGTNDRLVIDTSGNVGIGTASPTSGVKLEVVGANSKFQLTDSGYLYGGSTSAGSFAISPGSWSNGNLILNAAGSGNIILGNSVGNVGIGTASPNSKLDVRGKVYVYNTDQDAQLMLDSNTNQAILQGPSSRGLGFQLTGASGANSRFFFRNIAGTDLMYIADAGNVGIGTLSPTAALYVQPSSSEDEALQLRPKSGLSGYTLTFLLDDTAAYITHNSASRKLILGANNLNTLTMDVAGNVGIGTTSPLVKLQVAGTVKATAFNTGDIVFNKDDKPVWRMFEDEEGLYLESLKTGETYKFLLQKVERK